jgi:VWFA-related protein
MVRATFFLSLTLLAGALAAPAQDASQTGETFTSNSELVLVPVQVTDHYGRPVRGLKQQDFVLKSDGNPQRISLFDEMVAPPPAPLPSPLLTNTGSAAPAAPSGPVKFSNLQASVVPQQLFIVAIDTVNTPRLLQSWARDQFVKYLKTNPPRQPMEVVAITSHGLRQIQPFTTDSAALIEAVKKMHTTFNSQDEREVMVSRMDRNGQIDSYASLVAQAKENQALEAERGAGGGYITLQNFEELAWAYSGIPGRKTVLWLSCGFPLMDEVPDGPALLGHGPGNTSAVPHSSGFHRSAELLPAFQRAFTAMNKSNVTVYPVDVNGLPMDNWWDVDTPPGLFIHPGQTHTAPPMLIDANAERRDGMRELAHRTGGKMCTAGNGVQYCLEQAMAESSDYYLLGFYVPQQHRKLGWHKLKVSVSADHGEVRARNTYYLGPQGASAEPEQEADLRSAVTAGVDYTGILFSVEPGTRASGAEAPIVFKVSVPSTSILLLPGQEKFSFDVIAVPLSAKGAPIGKKSRVVKLDMQPENTQKVLASGWRLIDTIEGSASVAAVRVVVRDNATGRIGSLTFPVGAKTGS